LEKIHYTLQFSNANLKYFSIGSNGVIVMPCKFYSKGYVMHNATDQIMVEAAPEQSWRVLTDLARLPEWYVPAQSIKILSDGPVRKDWKFELPVKTLSGIVLSALGVVIHFDPSQRTIIWHGQAMGITGDSRWQIVDTGDGRSRIDHTFEGEGWLMFLSQKLGRNRLTVRKRLTNLKRIIEND
jgi:carbon monoxide dehydrogenase subunit G